MFKNVLFIIALLASFSAVATNLSEHLFHYNAQIVSVYDGDTVRADVDLGFNIHKKNEAFRLYGIDAPEVRGESRPAGLASRDYLRYLLKDRQLIIQTMQDKKGKYGRYIAILWVKGKGEWCLKDSWCNVNQHLVDVGHAVKADY